MLSDILLEIILNGNDDLEMNVFVYGKDEIMILRHVLVDVLLLGF